MKRILIGLGASIITLLLVEGVFSLFAGRSLLPGLEGERPSIFQTDEKRITAAAVAPGVVRCHEDPLVEYVMKPLDFAAEGATHATADALGMRVRPGPPPPHDAL
ncbi:MAG: hypothetical protein ABIK28_12015, partial [Planctomycetota bacterium]